LSLLAAKKKMNGKNGEAFVVDRRNSFFYSL
jgi:hypothetical protein